MCVGKAKKQVTGPLLSAIRNIRSQMNYHGYGIGWRVGWMALTIHNKWQMNYRVCGIG